MPALRIAPQFDGLFCVIGNCELRDLFHLEAEKGFSLGVITTQQLDGADEQELRDKNSSEKRQSSHHASPPANQAEYRVRRRVIRLR